MVIILVGPSGSGKDTQANLLEEKYGIKNISMGRLLREEIKKDSKLGRRINDYVSRGILLPDELVCKILKSKLKTLAYSCNFTLNGFPRKFTQIRFLDSVLNSFQKVLSHVFHLTLPEDQVFKRMRKQTQESEIRTDQTEEAMVTRYDMYKSSISPILDEYESRKLLRNIDARPDIMKIHNTIVSHLNLD